MKYRIVKRPRDVVLAGLGLLVTLPLFLILAAIVRFTLGRPVLFRQVRVGHKGRPFSIYKFRTMRDTRNPDGSLQPDESRLTRVGRILRSTSLDELPALWNVLLGHMSIVGPRPLPMRYLLRYTPQQARRHDIKPGITGWAQVNGRNALDWEEKFALDIWYVDHQSLSLDLRILAMTVFKLVTREGITQSGQATMEEFLGSRSWSRPTNESVSSQLGNRDVSGGHQAE